MDRIEIVDPEPNACVEIFVFPNVGQAPRTMNAKQILILFALILFFGFSFNAYACLVLVYAVATMGNGCADPEQEPVRQFCDTFKFLGP